MLTSANKLRSHEPGLGLDSLPETSAAELLEFQGFSSAEFDFHRLNSSILRNKCERRYKHASSSPEHLLEVETATAQNRAAITKNSM